jgi:hypothetical protein
MKEVLALEESQILTLVSNTRNSLFLLVMDRTTIDESNSKNERTDSSNSSEQEPRLSSDTLGDGS